MHRTLIDSSHTFSYSFPFSCASGERATPIIRAAVVGLPDRHKHDEKNGRPAETPDGFWELSFADSI